MINVGAYNNAVTGYYGNETASKASRADAAEKVKKTSDTSATAKNAESKLSAKAQEFLKNLREANDDMDFFVADSDEDMKGMMAGSTREFSVAFTADELEKMAADDDYANQKLDAARTAVDMSKSIAEQYDFDGKGIVAKIGITFDEDGNTKIFADLEKLSEKQKERIEQQRKEQAEERKDAAATKAESADARKIGAYGQLPETVKKVSLEATSEDDLIEQIQNMDWSKVKDQPADIPQGMHFDSAV